MTSVAVELKELSLFFAVFEVTFKVYNFGYFEYRG